MNEIINHVTPSLVKEDDLIEDTSVNKKLKKYYFPETQ
jgi:hypothetical protein